MPAIAQFLAAENAGAPAGAARPARPQRHPPPKRQINAFWLLLALAALLYAGYHFYFRGAPATAPAVPAVPEAPAAPSYADEFSRLMEQALAPLSHDVAPGDLQSDLRDMERRLAAETGKPLLTQNGRNLCWQLREVLKMRGQCERAAASIESGGFSALSGTSVVADGARKKDFALQEQARIWEGHVAQARPALSAGLERLRRGENP